jgi:uncharacterized lipoprotein YajG
MIKVVFFVWCATVIAGCSITVMPKNVPSSAGTDAISLTDAVVIVSNAEQDTSEYAVRDDKGAKTVIVANRARWSKKLVEAMASELAKRGARVRANANVTLNVSIPEITFNHFGDLFQFKVTAAVSSSSGWSRQYDGIAETSLGAVESASVMTERLAGDALSKVIKAMLRDEDFVAQVRSQPGSAHQGAIPAPVSQTH